jgi:stage II sporulation protein D
LNSKFRRIHVLAAAAAFAGAAACGPARRSPQLEVATLNVPDTVRVRLAGRIQDMALDDYVSGAVLAEILPVGESDEVAARVYELQSIVARTFAVAQLGRHRAEGFDLCDSTHCQRVDPARLKTSRFSKTAAAAVARTSGQVLTYRGAIAEALFHSDCGGKTASALEVWGHRAVPYLQIVDDKLPPETHRTWEVTATSEELRRALNADARTAVGAKLEAIEVLSRDDSGRAAGLGVRGARSYTVRGDVLRSVLNRTFGERAFMSTRFEIARLKTRYTFTGTGFGHGVGLCQRGALARLRLGASVEDVLGTYFPGTGIAHRP